MKKRIFGAAKKKKKEPNVDEERELERERDFERIQRSIETS